MEARRILKILEVALEHPFRLFKQFRPPVLPAMQLAPQKKTNVNKRKDKRQQSDSSFESSGDESQDLTKTKRSMVQTDPEHDFAFVQTNYTVFSQAYLHV